MGGGLEDVSAALPGARILGLPVAPVVDVHGLASDGVVAAVEPQRLVAVVRDA